MGVQRMSVDDELQWSTEEDSEEESWDPNAGGDSVNPEIRRHILLRKLLDQDHPIVTTNMHDFLQSDGVPEAMLSYVTRTTPLTELTTIDDTTAVPKEELPAPKEPYLDERDRENTEALKRAYNLMTLFIAKNFVFSQLVSKKLKTIVEELFKIFKPNARGSFYHFRKILQQLLAEHRAPVFEILKTNTSLLTTMINYIHHPAVVESLIDLLLSTSALKKKDHSSTKLWQRLTFLVKLANLSQALRNTIKLLDRRLASF